MTEDWPVELRGVTESVVTTRGPNDRWNVAALGLLAPTETDAVVTARTWGRTRTWRNFRKREGGYVQFVTDPVVFVRAALERYEVEEPVLSSAAAWVRVRVEATETGTDAGTQWVDWRLHPEDSERRVTQVPTFNRGYAAVIEATVAASRLDVEGYDTDRLRERISFFENVATRCGGPREKEAFERLRRAVE